jgi:hypothetical protein
MCAGNRRSERTTTEQARIALILARDGPARARQWVARTLQIYRSAVASPASHAAMPEYRPLFDAAIREFEAWLAAPEPAGNRHGPDRSD